MGGWMVWAQGAASHLFCLGRQEVLLPDWEMLPFPLMSAHDCKSGPAHETRIRSFSQA